MTGNVSAVFGVSGSRSAYEASGIIKKNNGKYLIIAASEGRARELAEDISYFAGRKTMFIPHEDHFFLGYFDYKCVFYSLWCSGTAYNFICMKKLNKFVCFCCAVLMAFVYNNNKTQTVIQSVLYMF